MATPGSGGSRGRVGGGAGQQTPRSTVFRRPRPQSMFYRDVDAAVSPGVRGGKLGTSPSWKDHSASGIDHLPPPPIATLDEGFGDGSSGGSDALDLVARGGASSFTSPFGGGSGTSFSRSPGFSTQTPLSRSHSRHDSGTTRKGFGSPYSDLGTPAHSPLQSQKLQFQSPEWASKGKPVAAGELLVESNQNQAILGAVSFLKPSAGGREAVEGEEWVTVYGFPFTELHLVFREFEKCGPIVNYVPGPPGSNYAHLRFQNRHDAVKAWQKNGTQLSPSVLVGVKPVDVLHLPALRELPQGSGPVSPPNTPRKDVLTASTSRPYYLNGAETQGPQPLRPLAAPVRSAVSRLVDLVFGV